MYRPGVVPRTPVPAAGAHHSCPKPLWQELARHARRCAAAKNPRSWAALVAAVPWVHPRSFADAIRLSQSMALTTTTATTADFDGAELFQAAAGSLLLHSRDARDLFNLLFVGNGTFPLLFAQPRPAQPLANTNPRRLVMLDGSYPGDGRPPGSAATADKDLLIDLCSTDATWDRLLLQRPPRVSGLASLSRRHSSFVVPRRCPRRTASCTTHLDLAHRRSTRPLKTTARSSSTIRGSFSSACAPSFSERAHISCIYACRTFQRPTDVLVCGTRTCPCLASAATPPVADPSRSLMLNSCGSVTSTRASCSYTLTPVCPLVLHRAYPRAFALPALFATLSASSSSRIDPAPAMYSAYIDDFGAFGTLTRFPCQRVRKPSISIICDPFWRVRIRVQFGGPSSNRSWASSCTPAGSMPLARFSTSAFSLPSERLGGRRT